MIEFAIGFVLGFVVGAGGLAALAWLIHRAIEYGRKQR